MSPSAGSRSAPPWKRKFIFFSASHGPRASMMLALRKRPVSVEQVDAAMERIQEKLLSSAVREVPTTRLGELVMRELKRIDKVGYVRFASVYRSFEDVDEFRQLIRDI